MINNKKQVERYKILNERIHAVDSFTGVLLDRVRLTSSQLFAAKEGWEAKYEKLNDKCNHLKNRFNLLLHHLKLEFVPSLVETTIHEAKFEKVKKGK